ncbi:disulfide oxidoreductase [Paenibacillus sp. NFR01]|uniref:disulfide oxidoreductase n=1 Tax=Paenibacillus sp. NFR01 TaxID=1566279 RepID=UPI0008CCB482|nr:disulfide oxidoreductase [Paenibacillus sp. NFR01]SET29816.1 disulfide bond formation protein DsbB [Paenibacillus sp. NFR01]
MGFREFCRRHCLYLAWFVSIIAVAGSLYLSEVLHYEPCKLCWFQRIFMYPQLFLLGIATYRGDKRIIPYVLPLTIVGGSISVYHYALQKIPGLERISNCTIGVPCSKDYLNYFGFITVPLLALIAFVLITVLLWFGREKEEADS